MTHIDDPDRLQAMPVGRIGDRFELLEEAGTGGMGTVYRARDHSTGGLVALKVLAPTEAACVERFVREREILEDLSHPGIVGYVASGATEDDEPYLAMQWLEGENLHQRLSRGKLTWREAAELGKRIAGALSAAHARGVVHRDLKPSNLFLVEKDVAKVVVLDFGIARLKAPNRGLTETGTILGTPGYMAPEQARGKKNIDERADLFALGCVLYRALTGIEAFDGEDILAILSKLAFDDPPRVIEASPDVPTSLDALVFDLIAKEPADRPDNAAEVEEALTRILAGETSLMKTWRRRDASTQRDTRDLARPSLPTPAEVKRRSLWPLLSIALVPALAFCAYLGWTSMQDVEVAPASEAPAVGDRSLCRGWARSLLIAQHPDGSFGIERHRTSFAWTTGQLLFALAHAHRSCSEPPRAPLVRGAEALARYRAGRWSEDATRPQTPSVAWAALASNELARATGDRALDAQATEARDLLLLGQRADGGFLYFADGSGQDESNAYSTVLATQALVAIERAAPSDAARGARERACAWLRRSIREDLGDPPLRTTAGLMEQATYVLAEARALGAVDGDIEVLTEAGRAIVERCELADGACGLDLGMAGETFLEHEPGHDPNLLTFWHPWATLAATRLAEIEALPADLRAQLAQIARWGEAAMGSQREGLAMAPAYQLSEYLFVAAELAE